MNRRRNGKEPSCEPCRIAKIKCDHGKPVCGRCRRRTLQAQCYYHPAPLTKIRTSIVELQDTAISPTAIDERDASGTFPTPLSNRWFGDTSVADGGSSNSPGLSPQIIEADISQRISIIVEVLQELYNLQVLHDLVRKHYEVSKVYTIPAPLIEDALPSFQTLFEQHFISDSLVSPPSLRKLAENVLRSTAKPIKVTVASTAEEYLAMHTGCNLRLEYLGLLYTIAARATHHVVYKNHQERSDFIQRIHRYSNICLQVASEIAPATTDAMVWLSLENTLLCTLAVDDCCEDVWRRLGDLSSHIFAMGYHRESSNTDNTPFFLAETRRSIFAKAYTLDVLLSTRMGRPLRISMKYSDTKLPLDLGDEDLLAEPAQREAACGRLSPDGWNLHGMYFTSSFRRARSMAMELREEVLPYEYRPMTLAKAAELSTLSIRCRQAWCDLPSHLRYTPDCWASDLPPTTCLTLLVIYLGFLQTDYEIYKAMERADPRATTDLVRVAYEMLSLVSGVSDARGRSIYIQHEFSSLLFSYGVPCAFVLTSAVKALSRQTQRSIVLPDGITRSSLVRTLSVLCAQLETISTTKEANAEICGQAAIAIARTLDELLNAPVPGGLEPAPSNQLLNGANSNNVSDLEMDPMFDDFDLEGWIKSIEGTSAGLEWCTF